MKKAEAFGKLTDGVVKIYNEKRFKSELVDMINGSVKIIVQKTGQPSTPQRNYYRGCVLQEITAHAKSFGNEISADQWHEHFKLKFNPIPIFDADGVQIDAVGGSTETLSPSDYAEFVENVIQWAATEMDLAIPPPSTQAKLFNINH